MFINIHQRRPLDRIVEAPTKEELAEERAAFDAYREEEDAKRFTLKTKLGSSKYATREEAEAAADQMNFADFEIVEA
jgi:hypothetical protein